MSIENKKKSMMTKTKTTENVFKVGFLYQVKSSIPVYMFKGENYQNIVTSTSPENTNPSSSIQQIGWTSSIPGVPTNKKVVIPKEQVVMCLAIESFPDRRRFNRDSPENSTKSKKDVSDTIIYEVMFLWNERRYVVVCQGLPSLKLIKSLFFSSRINLS